jgi:hypothetical protein
MPKIEKVFTLDITPERFVSACSDTELFELYLLIDSEVLRREKKKEIVVKPKRLT